MDGKLGLLSRVRSYINSVFNVELTVRPGRPSIQQVQTTLTSGQQPVKYTNAWKHISVLSLWAHHKVVKNECQLYRISVPMEHLRCQCKDFREILYWGLPLKCVEKGLFKIDIDIRVFMIICNIYFNYFLTNKNFQINVPEKTIIFLIKYTFLPKITPFKRQLRKTQQNHRNHMWANRIRRKRFERHAGWLRQ